uniref:EGF-like domain-containing protein n=1 Tax=Caenorhabditis japonica TaxID=281687 RepID=A0A8R1ERH5_CAEJA
MSQVETILEGWGAVVSRFQWLLAEKFLNRSQIPSSADSALGTNRYQCLCPLSARLDPNNDCVAIDRVACPRDACANGRCVPCDDDDNDVSKTASSKSIEKGDDLMPLCNSNEQRQGYRCLCEAGYLPPTCTVPTNPCHQNLCQNGAACNVTEHKSYELVFS